MARTPHRFEAEVEFTDSASNPAAVGGVTNNAGVFRMRDAAGVFDPRFTLTVVEVDLGAGGLGGSFSIAGTGLTVGKPVMVQQAAGPYTGKGDRADEAEMDQVHVTGVVESTTLIRCYWTCQQRVIGNLLFQYVVGA